MTRLFVSGSRNFKNVEKIKEIMEMVKKENYVVLVGDCYGVDYEVQKCCKELDIDCYVFHIGRCRNNVGFKHILVEGQRYVDKDIKMSELCDKGLVFWDGLSLGSYNNIQRLNKLNKKCLVIKDRKDV